MTNVVIRGVTHARTPNGHARCGTWWATESPVEFWGNGDEIVSGKSTHRRTDCMACLARMVGAGR